MDLYYCFVHPYLNYCVEIWGNTCVTSLEPLVKLQKKAVKIIVGASKRSSSDDIFKMLRIVPFRKLHTFNVYLFIYKIRNNLMPASILSMFVLNSAIHGHDTRQANKFHVDQLNTPVRKRSLRYQATLLYNCGDDIAFDIPYVAFKYDIKSILLF